MLKKKIGLEVIERGWSGHYGIGYYKIPSTLIIPENCERIGSYTFTCSKLRKVIIPKSVDWIGYAAFAYCKGATIILKKAESEFKEILPLAFKDCKYVKEEVRN